MTSGYIVIICASFLLLSACAYEEPSPPQDGQPVLENAVAQDLTGLPPTEVLRLKYESLKLNCSFWSTDRAPLSLKNTPKAKISVDLMTVSLPHQQVVQVISDQAVVDINLNINSLALAHGTYQSAEGTVYQFKFSPQIDMALEAQKETVFSGGRISGTYFKNEVLPEKIPQKLWAEAYSLEGARERFANYLECTVDAHPKPEYANQWAIIKQGTLNSCELWVSGTCMITRGRTVIINRDPTPASPTGF